MTSQGCEHGVSLLVECPDCRWKTAVGQADDNLLEAWPDLVGDARTALERMCLAQRQLRSLGWVVHCPPPKDRDTLTVQAGSVGIFRTRWMGTAYFCEDGGDLWPCTPLAWREVPR